MVLRKERKLAFLAGLLFRPHFENGPRLSLGHFGRLVTAARAMQDRPSLLTQPNGFMLWRNLALRCRTATRKNRPLSFRFEALEDRQVFSASTLKDISLITRAGTSNTPLVAAPTFSTTSLFGSAINRTGTASANALTDDSYEQNDTFTAASNLGALTANRTVSQLVMADTADWYKFSTASTGKSTDYVSINFTHALGDLDLALYNANGQLLRYSNGVSGTEKVSLSGLSSGTYYVLAYGYRGVTNPSYALNFYTGTTTATPTDDSFEDNDTLTAASDLGALTAVRQVANLVMADTQDWYKFSMAGAGTSSDFVNISFTNSQGDLALELYNAGGTRIGTSNGTSSAEQISLDSLAAGTYYVRVYGVLGAVNPNYTLTVDPGVASTTPPPPTTSGFSIQFAFSGLSSSQQAIFQQAAAKWQSVIVGDLPNATYNGVTVDDILISATATAIDGSGGILGQAGPDRFRSGSDLPYHGAMEFDSADLATMQANGTLLGVILHEMGNVLGVGTLWEDKGLLSGAGTSNPIFTGTRAVAEYNSLFGLSTAGVPVENTGGAGTSDSHWRESIFSNELMTGWVGPGTSMPLSRITAASLADIGYTVNMAAADPYTPPGVTSAVTISSATGSSTGTSTVVASIESSATNGAGSNAGTTSTNSTGMSSVASSPSSNRRVRELAFASLFGHMHEGSAVGGLS